MLFAITFTLAKAVLFYVQPLFFIGIRMILAGSLLLGYMAYKKQLSIKRESLFLLAQIALFHIYIAYLAEFWALQYTSSAKTALIYNFSPLITALLAYGFTQEWLTKRQWLGLFVGFLGLIPWIYSTSDCEFVAGRWGSISAPEIALLIAVISACYGWLVMNRLIKTYQYSPILINGIGMLSGGLLALATSFYFEGFPAFIERSSQEICAQQSYFTPFLTVEYGAFVHFLVYLFLLIIVANIICYNLYGYLLTKYSPTFLSFSGFLCPLFAAFFGWLFFNEVISVYFLLTFPFIIAGLYLFYQDELSKKVRF